MSNAFDEIVKLRKETQLPLSDCRKLIDKYITAEEAKKNFLAMLPNQSDETGVLKYGRLRLVKHNNTYQVNEVRANSDFALHTSTAETLLDSWAFSFPDIKEQVSLARAALQEPISLNVTYPVEFTHHYMHEERIFACVQARNMSDEKAHDIALHVAANKFMYVEAIPPHMLETIKYAISSECKDIPEKVRDRVIQGKVDKYVSEQVLYKQPFVKNPKITVEQYIGDGSIEAAKRIETFRIDTKMSIHSGGS